MKTLFLAICLCGIAAAQPTPIPTGQNGPNYQTAVNAQFLWMFNNSARPTATMTINGVTITLGATNTLTLADLTEVWGSGSRPVMANALGTSGHCVEWAAAGLADSGNPCGTGTGSTIADLKATKVSGTVVTVDPGTFRYGTNVSVTSGTITYTLHQIAITSIVTGSVTTRLNTAIDLNGVFISGNTVNVQLVGSGLGCAAGTGVFVGSWDYSNPNGLTVAADTSLGCTFTSGLIGAQTGGSAIIFGNSSGQIELSHSAAMGAIVTTTDPNAVSTQTATGIFPNGSTPLASVDISAGAFSAVTDKRAYLSNQEIQSGPGIDVTMVGGQVQVATGSNIPKTDAPSVWLNSVIMKDATKTMPWRGGTGSPNSRDNCSYIGEAFFQTDGPVLWVCTTAGTPGTWANLAAVSASTLSTLTNTALLSLTNGQLGTLVN